MGAAPDYDPVARRGRIATAPEWLGAEGRATSAKENVHPDRGAMSSAARSAAPARRPEPR